MSGIVMALSSTAPSTYGYELFLDAGNKSSYSGTGTSWTDLSVYNNNGTLVNSPTYSTDNYGLLNFSTNQYADVGSAIQPNRTTGFSLNVWINFNSLTGWQTFIGQDRSAVGARGALYFQKATNGATSGDGTSNTACIKIVDTSGNTIYAEDTEPVTTGTWYNFTGTVSSTELKLYRNGSIVSTNTDSTAMDDTTGNMLVGAGYYNDVVQDFIEAKLPIAQYFNRVLSNTEILSLYNQFSYRFGV